MDSVSKVVLTELSNATEQSIKIPVLTTVLPRTRYYTLCQYTWTPEVELNMIKVLRFYVYPAVFVVGFSANMISIGILKRSGLRKPSNILLLGMVIADSMVQLSAVNFGETLAYLGPDYKYPNLCGWQYSDGVNYFLLLSDILATLLSNWGQYINTTIPIFITVERFLAVYMPMTFKNIVTCKTAWACVIFSFIVWLPWNVYYMALNHVTIYNLKLSNVMLFHLIFSREDQFEIFTLLNNVVFPYFSSWLPIGIIGVGSTLIAVKVKITLGRRKKMTSNDDKSRWSVKTTRTLLITCLFLFISLIISFFADYYNEEISNGYYYFKAECIRLNIFINASCNFFVYIATNRNFANHFRNILLRRGRTSK